jgi:hypothetical protein
MAGKESQVRGEGLTEIDAKTNGKELMVKTKTGK